MLSIVIPMAGESVFYSTPDNHFPKPFYEVLGRPMIEIVVENLMQIEGDKRFIFVINDNDAKKYRLDNVLRMLTKNKCEIVIQSGATKGAVCSLLLAVKHLNNESPLLISNADQVISHDMNSIVSFFESSNLDGGGGSFMFFLCS
jgi:choline kinase